MLMFEYADLPVALVMTLLTAVVNQVLQNACNTAFGLADMLIWYGWPLLFCCLGLDYRMGCLLGEVYVG